MGAASVTGVGQGSAKTKLAYIAEQAPVNSVVASGGDNGKLLVQPGAVVGQIKLDDVDTPDYLTNKLLAGTNIILSTSVGLDRTLTINAVYTSSVIPVVVDLGTVGPVFSPSISNIVSVIKGVVNEDFTMSDITVTDGVYDKMIFRIELTQGSTGGDSVIWSSNFVGGDLIPLSSIGLSITAGKTDLIIVEYDSFRDKYMVVGFIRGIDP